MLSSHKGTFLFQSFFLPFSINWTTCCDINFVLQSLLIFIRLPFRLETSQRSLMAAQDEHKALSDLNEMLRRHNDNLKSQHDW